MKATDNKNFTVNIAIAGHEDRPVTVNYKETTDGTPFYECNIDGQKVQLRKDGQWELIWGELSSGATEKLGKAIEAQSPEQ